MTVENHCEGIISTAPRTMPEPGTRILIVEDSSIQAHMLKRMLEKAGWATAVAKNGVEGLSMADQYLPELIISDIVMPEMDGFDLCRQIKLQNHLKTIPFVLLTSLKGPEDVIKALSCEADDFITKPYREEMLLSRIMQITENNKIRKGNHFDKKEPIAVSVAGKNYQISAGRQRIIDFLLSAYETAVCKNSDLIKAQNELKTLNQSLEKKVDDRTALLNQKIMELQKIEKELRKTSGDLNRSMIDLEAANKKIMENQQKVVEEERLKVLLQMAGATAHELNQPLMAMLGAY